VSDADQRPDGPSTTVPSHPGDLAFVLRRNIELLRARREAEAKRASLSDKVAQRITDFTGSMLFVALHLVLFGGWIGVNLAGPEAWRFDPTFVALAMVASVEAIFLSTFVLISQNRLAAQQDRRSELDLQINLLAEHEVTRLIDLTGRIAEKLGVQAEDPELSELKRDVAPDAVLDRLATAEETNKGRTA
jgi:uncharacterized membrane protein